MVKSGIINYWEDKLFGEASLLKSVEYYKPNFMGFCKPHPIWSTVGSNLHEVPKAIGFCILDS